MPGRCKHVDKICSSVPSLGPPKRLNTSLASYLWEQTPTLGAQPKAAPGQDLLDNFWDRSAPCQHTAEEGDETVRPTAPHILRSCLLRPSLMRNRSTAPLGTGEAQRKPRRSLEGAWKETRRRPEEKGSPEEPGKPREHEFAKYNFADVDILHYVSLLPRAQEETCKNPTESFFGKQCSTYS